MALLMQTVGWWLHSSGLAGARFTQLFEDGFSLCGVGVLATDYDRWLVVVWRSEATGQDVVLLVCEQDRLTAAAASADRRALLSCGWVGLHPDE